MSLYWEGQRLRLRAVEPKDAAAHFLVNQDERTHRMLDQIYPPSSMVGVERWASETSLKGFVNDEYSFQMESLGSDQLVGHLNTHDCNRRVGIFRYGINVLPEHQGKGYASEAARLVLRYYFDELRYQKCNVHVFAINEASIVLHERLGFVLEGRERRAVYTNGEHSDQLIYGITKEEFFEKHGTSFDR